MTKKNNLKEQIRNILFSWEGHGTKRPYASSEELVEKLESLIKEREVEVLDKIKNKLMPEWRPEFYKKDYNISKATSDYANGYNAMFKEVQVWLDSIKKSLKE